VIKAVFFDWFNTLSRFDPPRVELYHQAFQHFGIELDFKPLMRGILKADRYYFAENSRLPAKERSVAEQLELYSCYPKAILDEAGIETAPDFPLKVLKLAMERHQELDFVLFDDVLAVLNTLKERGLILGILTNASQDMNAIARKLGLESVVNFIITSQEAGSDKPHPQMFLMALKRAGVAASESVHVGDQYEIDVVGARGAGIKPILIDRYDISDDVTDCPHIRDLTELVSYL